MSRHVLPPDRVVGLAPGQGLSTAEVQARRRYGANDVVPAPSAGWRALARATAQDPMLWFLVGTAALFALLGDGVEALTLAVAILPLLGMDAYLHRRTRASTEGLASRLAAQARVQRDGQWCTLAARDLVPGDLVQVDAGSYFPADGVLVEGRELQVDESTLSGESMPLRKQALSAGGALPAQVDGVHWAAAGTRLLTGPAGLRVVWTGAATRYGEIVQAAAQGRQARTPLQLAIGQLVAVLLSLALTLCLLLAGIRLWQGHGWVDALLSGATLAVAAIPEEFPVVFTFFLGLGVFRLARRQALVRRAVAVENMGRISCICTDKTGTLTAGALVLAHRLPAPGWDEAAVLQLAVRVARGDSGDPLDAALCTAAGSSPEVAQRRAMFPFTEQRRRETAVWTRSPDRLQVVTKGAPETVFALCALTPEALAHWTRLVDVFAAQGHKVIACAERDLAADTWAGGEPDRGFAFAGLLAFEDPVREGVQAAVAECLAAGIRVVMVTGDHPVTAAAVARAIGLGGAAPRVLTLDGEDQPLALPADVQVVARAAPAAKLALVRALQAQGEVVAVTGDGVNDVPALQAADIGIAMGERGTRSARETAAIVLLDDNFRTLVNAIGEGRQLFRNLQLSFAYLLMVHIPLVISAAVIPLTGAPLLYLPVHIVWLELIIHPTALLAFQDLPRRGPLAAASRTPPRFFSPAAWALIVLVGTLVTATVVWGYGLALAGGDVAHARAMAMASLVIASAALCAALSRLRTRPARAVVLGSLLSLGLMLQWPPLAGLLHLRPLHGADWAAAAAGGLLAGALALALAPVMRGAPRPA